MRKRLLWLVPCLLLALLTAGCSNVLGAEESKITYKIKDGEAIVQELPNKSYDSEIVIPAEYEGYPVTEIADFAAVNLESVTVIRIGKNIRTIGLWSFENNQQLTAFEVDAANESFCSVDGVLYSKDQKTLLFYPPARGVQTVKNEDGSESKTIEFMVPDTVEIIRTKAFYKCRYLTVLTLPAGLLSIEEKAFFRCSALRALQLPSALTFIGKDAFGYCTSLSEITIPAAVRQIDEYAFYNCTSLKQVEVQQKEGEMTLGKKWYPTNNGLEMDDLELRWAE